MKRKISLLLALALVISALVGLTAIADGETAAYKPEIAYTNVSYGEGLVLMFAVNVPDSLADGEKVELLFWSDVTKAEGFSARDQFADTLTAEADKVTIGGASYYVFKCSALDAAMMTNVVYARPVFTDKEGKRTYGDIVDYSVVEYVKTACGEFDGFAGLAEDTKTLLRSLLDFGATAQIYLGGDEPYTPNGFLANDTLHKIWVTPVINGVAKEKVFAGFFKHEEGASVTVTLPFYDGKSPVSCKDAAGNSLTAGASVNTYTVASVDSDVSLAVEYRNTTMAVADPSRASAPYYYSTVDFGKNNGNSFDHKIGGLSVQLNGGSSKFPYQAIGVIADPYNSGEYTYIISSSGTGTVTIGDSVDDWKVSMNPYHRTGFGDTIEEVVSIELVVGRNGDGSFNSTSCISLRGKGGANYRAFLGYFTEEGAFRLCNAVADENGKMTWNGPNATYVELPTKIAETGYTRYVITVDFASEIVKAYAEDPTSGELVYQGETANPGLGASLKDSDPWATAWDPERLEFIQAVQTNIQNMEAELSTKDINGDGIADPLKDEQGNTDWAVVKYWNDYYNSFLIKYYATYLGDITK